MEGLESQEKASAQSNTCKALVLSGGGSNGAWMAGVLYGLVNYADDPRDFEYDVVSGVSIGSIIASGLAMFEPGDEARAVSFIHSIWTHIKTSDIYQEWPLMLVSGLYRHSMYDTTPGFKTMKRLIKHFHGYKRALSLSSVDVETGQIVTLTDKNTRFGDLHKAIMASASVPGFFPPTKLNGRLLIDGMTAWNTNAQEAIDRCREMVDDDSQITVDIIICHEDENVAKWDKSGNAWQNYWRMNDIRNRYHSTNATVGVMRAHPNINWRH